MVLRQWISCRIAYRWSCYWCRKARFSLAAASLSGYRLLLLLDSRSFWITCFKLVKLNNAVQCRCCREHRCCCPTIPLLLYLLESLHRIRILGPVEPRWTPEKKGEFLGIYFFRVLLKHLQSIHRKKSGTRGHLPLSNTVIDLILPSVFTTFLGIDFSKFLMNKK